MYDTIVIGGGPAGLTSALYLLRANKKVLVLEAETYGGQIIQTTWLENYPGIQSISGFDFATNLFQQVKDLGGEFRFEKVLKITPEKRVITSTGEYQSKTVIIANGAAKRKLNLDKEDFFIGRGVSYCPTCDGNFFKGKVVCVYGGGNTALTDAIYLSQLAEKVYVINRSKALRGEAKNIQILENKEKVEFYFNSAIISLNGKDKLESITIENKEGVTRRIDADGLFVAIGQEPNNKAFENVVHLNSSGYISTPDGVHTKTPGIYVAGDTKEKELRQVTTAVGDGSIAADVAIREMEKDLEER